MGNPSATTVVTGIGLSSVQAIGADRTRRKITFYNPNASDSLLICQATDVDGNSLAATFASPGGGIPILAQAGVSFEGNIQGAWNVAASSSGPDVLTIYVES